MTQKEFDFSRGRQMTLVRMAELPSAHLGQGNTVSGASMKAVLAMIDSHAGKDGECWVAAKTLAIETGLKERTVRRSIAGLRLLNLIIEREVRQGRSTYKHRRICFPNLADFEVKRGSMGELIHPDCESIHPDCESIHPDPETVHPDCENSSLGLRVTQKEKKEHIKKSVKRKATSSNGFFELFQGEEFTTEQLKDPHFLDRVYRAAVEHCEFPETDFWKRSLFGFGARCWRKRRELKKATGFFFCGIGQRSREWLLKQVDDNDRDQGKKLIDRLEGRCQERSGNLDQGQAEAAEARDFQQWREQQMAALAAEFGGQKL